MKLSIITINYNNAEGLERTLNSVLTQTYGEIEHIIVDGASTDNSVDVIKEYVRQIDDRYIDDRSTSNKGKISVIWSSEPDTGIYNAMNKGIRRAAGEYCLFLNSGDFLIAPDVIERVFEQKPTADIVCARTNVSDNGKVTWVSPLLNHITLRTLYFNGIPHQATFIRRSLFDKYGLYREDFRYNSDTDFWYKAIVLGDATTQGVDVITTDYNLDGVSASDSHNETFINEHNQILSQGFLPKVIPDYNKWRSERGIYHKYSWIEQHKCLQKFLNIYQRICKHLK